jgi:hypothetical protein
MTNKIHNTEPTILTFTHNILPEDGYKIYTNLNDVAKWMVTEIQKHNVGDKFDLEVPGEFSADGESGGEAYEIKIKEYIESEDLFVIYISGNWVTGRRIDVDIYSLTNLLNREEDNYDEGRRDREMEYFWHDEIQDLELMLFESLSTDNIFDMFVSSNDVGDKAIVEIKIKPDLDYSGFYRAFFRNEDIDELYNLIEIGLLYGLDGEVSSKDVKQEFYFLMNLLEKSFNELYDDILSMYFRSSLSNPELIELQNKINRYKPGETASDILDDLDDMEDLLDE